jgi:hypothetical protein
MTIVLYILSFAVLLFAACIAAMNWCAVIVSLRNRRRGIDKHHSTVPLFSVILTVVALLLYPRPNKAWMLAVPLLDIGNWAPVIGLLWLPVIIIRDAKAKKSTEPGAEGESR